MVKPQATSRGQPAVTRLSRDVMTEKCVGGADLDLDLDQDLDQDQDQDLGLLMWTVQTAPKPDPLMEGQGANVHLQTSPHAATELSGHSDPLHPFSLQIFKDRNCCHGNRNPLKCFCFHRIFLSS